MKGMVMHSIIVLWEQDILGIVNHCRVYTHLQKLLVELIFFRNSQRVPMCTTIYMCTTVMYLISHVYF